MLTYDLICFLFETMLTYGLICFIFDTMLTYGVMTISIKNLVNLKEFFLSFPSFQELIE